MHTTTLQKTLRPAISGIKRVARPWPMMVTLLGADLIGIATAVYLGVTLRLWFEGVFDPEFYWRLWPLLAVFTVIYAVFGLYPGVGLSPVDELRSVSVATTLSYLLLGSVIFFFKEDRFYSRGAFLMAWVFSIALVIIARTVMRRVCARHRWWGYPAVVFGAGKTGQMVVRTLQQHQHLGLKPVVILDDDPDTHGTLAGIPVMGGLSLAPLIARRLHVPYGVVAMPGVRRSRLIEIIENYGQPFEHLLLIPDLFDFSSLWVRARDLSGVLGLEVQQRLLLPGPQLTKFSLEYLLTLCLSVVSLPLIGLIALLIKLDSPGPVFFGHRRIGRGGRYFTAWKFRTMVRRADRVLEDYLVRHPEERLTWLRSQKLKCDPRITTIGKFLRRTSLDELPQLLNVLCREMSLVGPRPIVDEEVAHYRDKFSLYVRVLPGITGLWQVSGRSDTTYEQRVSLDAYYVRNWSVWLDTYILIKTLWVVLEGKGAY